MQRVFSVSVINNSKKIQTEEKLNNPFNACAKYTYKVRMMTKTFTCFHDFVALSLSHCVCVRTKHALHTDFEAFAGSFGQIK